MKLSSLFEQLDRSVALKLQQRLIDESDGLFDVELKHWSPTGDSGDDGIELMITGPFGTTNSLYVSPTADGLRITKNFGSTVARMRSTAFKGYGADDEGIDKAVKLTVRYMLGSMWVIDQKLTADLLKPLRDQKRGVGVKGKWYKLKCVKRSEVGPDKLYLASIMHYSGTYRYCTILTGFDETWKKITNVLTSNRWKMPEQTGSLEFYELIELQ